MQNTDRLRESEERLRTLFEGIEDAVLVHDLNGAVLDCNSAACRRLGYERAELLALRISDIETPEFAAGFAQRCVRQMASGVYVYEAEHRAKDGRRIPVDINSRVITYQGGPAVVIAIRDITERKRVEEELELMREAAEAANAAKSEFLANMSHEIRTPMNGILGMTELTLGTQLTAEQREYLQMAKSSADSLLKLINDILDFSKIEAGKLELEPIEFHLRDGLADLMQSLAVRAHEKGLDLVYRVSPELPDNLVGDPGRLKQVLINLVGNAIKFTKHGEILVDVEPHSMEPGKEALRFSVTDTGIGVEQRDLRAIFEPFKQADGSTTRKYGGTGLGLAISAQLVSLMGGEIWVESERGKGSAFHFTARLSVAPRQPENPKLWQPVDSLCDLKGLSALIVDENAASRRILQEMLSNWGMVATCVSGVEPAIVALDQATAAKQPIAILILDTKLSGDGGLRLVENIRNRGSLAWPGVLLLIAGTERNDSGKWKGLGISAQLTKPVRQSELLNAIVATSASVSLAGLGAFAGHLRQSENEVAPPVRSRHILAAEDNPVNQRLLLKMLQKRGHSVVMTSNGLEAIEAFGREKFDIALFDVQMPEMSGLEATAAIRAKERQQAGRSGARGKMPIIAITANAMKGDRELCIAAGMDGYIAKPIRQGELFEMVENMSIIQVPAPEVHFDGALFEGDPEFLAEIVNLFLETCPGLLTAVKDGVLRKDAAALCRAAHTLKGAVANFGAESVVEQAKTLEIMGKDGDLSGADEACQSLHALMKALLPELEAALGKATEKQAT